MKKSKQKTQRISFTRLRDIKGHLTQVHYHYYPERRKLFAVVNGSVKMSYAGAIATNVFNRLNNGQNQSAAKEPGAQSA